MAKEGLFACLCAGTLLTFSSPHLAAAEDAGGNLTATLSVQTALQLGREQLLHGNPRGAVYVLENQLAYINGNRDYLTTLRDAYRAYVKELRLANQDEAAQRYFQRLLILDPGAGLDAALTRAANSTVPPQTGASKPAAPAEASKTPATTRGKGDDDPFNGPPAKQTEAQTLVERAEQEFDKHQYGEASRFYEKAHQSNQAATSGCLERWGYCRMRQVAEQLNRQAADGTPLTALDQEVRVALAMAPRLQSFGQNLLREIQERGSAGRERKDAETVVAVRHGERTQEGWHVADTANFRIYHNQSRELVEKVAQAAERTRTDMQHKWFGEQGEAWNPRCELYLHASGQDYSRATGVPANSPGHSTIRSDSSRVIARRIDLHCDVTDMLVAVLPHEATHVIIAGKFGDAPVPRWADEGMAVLTEPRDKIERHLRNLPQYLQERNLFGVRQLMHQHDYPDPRYIGPFYAQSVSVVEFLCREKDTQTFTHFLRDGLRSGYEAALQKYYGFHDFNEVERRWREYAYRDLVTTTSSSSPGR